MSDSAVASLLVNERIAVRQQRNVSREDIHNKRRTGLTAVPSSNQYDEAEMTKICAALHLGRNGNVSVTQLRTLKQLLLHPNGMVSFMKDTSALHGLIGELSGKRPIHQLEAAYVCINLGLQEEEQCLPVCRAAGPYLIQYLEGSSYYLQEASAWAIGNLAGTSVKCAAIICAQGAVTQLIQLLSGPQKGLCLAAAYALNLIIHSNTSLQDDELVALAQSSSDHLSTEPEFCILLYLLSCFPVCEKPLLDNGVMTRCIVILTGLVDTIESSLKTFTALLRTVGNLSSGVGALEIIDHEEAGVLLRTLFTAPSEHLRKEASWICANLMCHQHERVRTYAEQAGLPQGLQNYQTIYHLASKP